MLVHLVFIFNSSQLRLWTDAASIRCFAHRLDMRRRPFVHQTKSESSSEESGLSDSPESTRSPSLISSGSHVEGVLRLAGFLKGSLIFLVHIQPYLVFDFC